MAARGVLDFAGADLRDLGFWRAVRRIADAADREDAIAARRAALDVALAGYGAASARGVDDLSSRVDGVNRALDAYREALFPGSAAAAAIDRKRALADMDAEWAAVYGDPNSPEVRAKIEDACRRMAPPKAKPATWRKADRPKPKRTSWRRG